MSSLRKRRRGASRAALALASAASAACSGEPLTVALEQPIRVADAQFREGALPGRPPLSVDEINAGVVPEAPNVTGVVVASGTVPLGEPARTFSGRTTPDATAVAVKLDGLGSGYWIVPTRSADVLNDNELEWRFQAAFSRRAPAGRQRLLLAALDADGRSGTQTERPLCLESLVPDNGNACDPTIAPPALVVSLSWGSAVDLDLRVITPGGKVVDAKKPSTALEDEDGNVDPEGAGQLTADSLGNCVDDGRRREDLLFQTSPEPGVYLVYANLYDACGHDGVHFEVSLHTAVAGEEPDTFASQKTYSQAGQLQAVHANGGTALGMFIASFPVN